MNATVAQMLAGLAMMLDAVHVDDETQDAIAESFDGLREYCDGLDRERMAGLPEGPTPGGWFPRVLTPRDADEDF